MDISNLNLKKNIKTQVVVNNDRTALDQVMFQRRKAKDIKQLSTIIERLQHDIARLKTEVSEIKTKCR